MTNAIDENNIPGEIFRAERQQHSVAVKISLLRQIEKVDKQIQNLEEPDSYFVVKVKYEDVSSEKKDDEQEIPNKILAGLKQDVMTLLLAYRERLVLEVNNYEVR